MTTLVLSNSRSRISGQRQASLVVPHQRLMTLMLMFAAGVILVTGRLLWLSVYSEARANVVVGSGPKRGDIVDRNGIVLARTIGAWSIGVHANKLLGDPKELAPKLAALMPERSAGQYLNILQSGTRFTYLRRRAMPDLVAKVNALGEPGMAYAREPERLYPQTTLAAHVLGFTDFDGRGVTGMERVLDTQLTDERTRGTPVALAIDARVQAAVESELTLAMASHRAKGATAVVLDVDSGEVVTMVSLPVFNPNKPGLADSESKRNNVTQSVYELGSTFKAITFANAIETGVAGPMSTLYEASAPLRVGRYTINDDHPMGRPLTLPEAFIHSSNIVTARIAEQLGQSRTEALFRKLHFDAAPDIELVERGKPIWPTYWGRTTVMTIGYGHGMAVTPLHLATAYAALVNGGIWRPATLLKVAPGKAARGSRVFSQGTSDRMRQLLRLVVTNGTGRKANSDGLRVGGKTGTAEKPSAGGYAKRALISTFAAAFPMDSPRYVVITMLDEPQGNAESFGFRTAGMVVAPVSNRIVARIGPMLGVMPDTTRDIDERELMPLLGKSAGKP